MSAPVPESEEMRLRTLWNYRILDTSSERTFDDLTRLAATICQAPIALISVLDEKRQWFKSRIGMSAAETSRDMAFCAHAIMGDEVFVVSDARCDPRFEKNPLVTSEPNIRFYAGAPLQVIGGERLGTLCVIDREPRALSDEQLQALEILRDSVVAQLELRRALLDLTDIEKLLPMCAWCRDVKTTEGQWLPLHEYVTKAANVTHGMCPACSDGWRTRKSGGSLSA